MQEHIDTAQIVGSNINFLSVETIADGILTENFLSFQEQRTWTAGRIIYFINFCFSHSPKPCKQFRHICRSEEFTTRLSGIGCIHRHKVFICITKSINGMIFDISEIHFTHTIQQFHEFFITLCNGRTQFIAVNIIIIEQSCKITLSLTAFRWFLNMTEYTLQCFIQILIICSVGTNIAEQLAWQNKKSFFFYQSVSCLFRILIRHFGKIKISIACIYLTIVYVIAQIFRNISIEHCSKNIIFKVPSIYCSPQFICNCPNCAMQFITLLFLFCINHSLFLRYPPE